MIVVYVLLIGAYVVAHCYVAYAIMEDDYKEARIKDEIRMKNSYGYHSDPDKHLSECAGPWLYFLVFGWITVLMPIIIPLMLIDAWLERRKATRNERPYNFRKRVAGK